MLTACASESSRTLEVPKVASYQSHYQGTRSPIAVGKFDNRSSYMRGIFSDGVDRLGSQAKTVLITHLQQTGRFSVLDRDNMEELKAEAGIKQQANSGGGLIGMLVVAVVNQIANTITDKGHEIAGITSFRLLSADMPNGILHGPYSPKYQAR
ncbi:GNA1162 family protein [Aeromonas bivalvium]|uniref:GNA1162 family protein n=1 Tax=Aeromonas bivalvium TaxID=440079 RepID=UPI001FCD2D56|nr:GNA1162 family protein [Aeromonas bivalvium]